MSYSVAACSLLAIVIMISSLPVLDGGAQLHVQDLIPNTIAVDRLGISDQGTGCGQAFTTRTWTQITSDLPNRLLLAIVNVKGTAANTWIHYGDGSATDLNLTFLGASNDAGISAVSQMYFYIWDPPIGAAFSVTATTTISNVKMIGESVVLYNVDQSLGIFFGSPVETNGGGVTSQVSITAAMNQGDYLFGSIITLGIGAVPPAYTALTSFTIQETATVAYAGCPGTPANFAALAIGTQPSAGTFTWQIVDNGGNPFSDQDVVRLSPTFTETQQPPGGQPREIHPCTTPLCRLQDLGNQTVDVLLHQINPWVWVFVAIAGLTLIYLGTRRKKSPAPPGPQR